MAGLDSNMLAVIGNLAQNRIQNTKKAAIKCYIDDTAIVNSFKENSAASTGSGINPQLFYPQICQTMAYLR